MNLTYSVGFCASLIRLFDDSRSGRLYFHNWMTLHSWLLAVQNAFRNSDTDGSGSLDFQELYRCLASLDLTLDQTPFLKLCETFDVAKRNQLGLAEFIGVCAFLKASKAVFIAFDQARTGRITLDFNQVSPRGETRLISPSFVPEFHLYCHHCRVMCLCIVIC